MRRSSQQTPPGASACTAPLPEPHADAASACLSKQHSLTKEATDEVYEFQVSTVSLTASACQNDIRSRLISNYFVGLSDCNDHGEQAPKIIVMQLDEGQCMCCSVGRRRGGPLLRACWGPCRPGTARADGPSFPGKMWHCRPDKGWQWDW